MKEKKQKEKKEKEWKEKEKRRIEREKKEKERKEKEEKERIEKERKENENEETKRNKIEKMKKEKDEIKKEKENKKREELKKLIRGRTEDKLIKEDIKNDDDNKDDSEFYKTYIINLENKKNKNHEEEEIKKYYNFMPMINKHPENIYLKAISNYRINKEKLKNYNKRKGLFDIRLNRPRTNKFFISMENRENSDITDDKEELINKMKTNNKNLHSRNNNNELKKNFFHEKKISLKIGRGNSTIYSYRKMNNPLMKSFHKKFSTYDLSSHRKNNSKKEYKFIKKENNEEITLDEMVNYLCEKKNDKLGQRKGEISNQNNSRKNDNDEQKNKIFNSLNEPLNPYSPLFYNNILNLNYNAGIQYKGMERGVPHLEIKNLKKPSLPLLSSKISLNKERLISNTFSSCYKLYRDSKLGTLPNSSSSRFNKNSSKNKSNKSLKENKILIQSYDKKKRFNENCNQKLNNEKMINNDERKQ